MDYPECEQFKDVPHRYKICRCERLPEKCEQWRAKHVGKPFVPLVAVPADGQPQRQWTLLERAIEAGKSAARVAANGFHPLDDEKIAERLAICQTCNQFTGSTCKICGCGCNGKPTLLNKLAHPEQQCPHDPPKWGPVQ